VPTLPILSDEQYSTGLAELEENLREVAGMSLDEYRRVIEARLLGEKLAEVMGEELVPATEEQVHARHILLRVEEPTPEPTPEPVAEGEPTPTPEPEGARPLLPPPGPRDDAAALALAQELRERLVAGEDFAALAQEYSDDTGSATQGGDLGWFGRGAMVAPFEEAAFSLEPGQISEPVKSDFGYHLIEVIEKDANRAKDEAALQQERQQAYQTWLQEQVSATPVERPADLVSKLPRNLETLIPQAQVPGQQVPVQ
jgi:peptidyl-prolyl cis-trans isomerase SurA